MNKPWSLAYTFFRSLNLHHLEKSLFSLSIQTVKPDDAVFYDNNTSYTPEEIQAVAHKHFPEGFWKFVHDKHGDPTKTATYCHNKLIPMLAHDTFVLSRADLIQDPTFCLSVLEAQGGEVMNFSASYMLQMPLSSKSSFEAANYETELECFNWRQNVQNLMQNNIGAQEHKAPELDAAAFCMNRKAWELSGGYDEHLCTWGLWNMDFQQELRNRGVRFKIVPAFLTFHQLHQLVPEEGERDLVKAHEQWKSSPKRKK